MLKQCVEVVFTSREKAFCVLEYARTNSNKAVQHAFVRTFSKKSPTAKQIWSWQKIPRRRMPVQNKRIWTTSNSGGEGRAGSPNTLAKPQKVHKKNKSGDSDSSNDSLASTKETLGNETLQTAARSDHNVQADDKQKRK